MQTSPMVSEVKRYSAYGSAEFELYIQRVLADISSRFQQSVDTNLCYSLILGGGYGRGEGGVLTDNGIEKLYNDLDFFVISSRNPIFYRKKIEAQLHALHLELSDKYGIEVDFASPVSYKSLFNTSISLMMFDLKNGHEVVWGNKNVLSNLPKWTSKDLPIMEGIKLLLNRSMGLFFAKEYCISGKEKGEKDFINRNIHKAYQAIGEAILISEGKYHWSGFERITRLETIDIGLYAVNSAFVSRYISAMEFKMRPSYSACTTDSLVGLLTEAIETMKQAYLALWSRYLKVDLADYLIYKERLSKTILDVDSPVKIIKNLMLNIRYSRILNCDLRMNVSYPRLRLFIILPWLLFGEKYENEYVCRVLAMEHTNDVDAIKQRFVDLWRRYN